MKVDFALKIQEAWKTHFETRPAPAVNDKSTEISAHEAIKLGSGDSVSEHGQGAKRAIAVVPANTSVGYRDESITVDARKNKKGQWVLTKGAEAFDQKQDLSKFRRPDSFLDPYSLVVTRRFSNEGDLLEVLAEIQSPRLIHVIRSLVQYWPDSTFRVGDTIKCEDPPKLVFHHRKELTNYKDDPTIDKRTALHVGFLLHYLVSRIGDQIEQFEAFLAIGMVKFGHLWMMFKPGSLVYEREMEQLYYLENAEYVDTACGRKFSLSCHYVDYNGEKVGKVKRTILIGGFGNPRDLNSLAALPLSMCADLEEVQQKLRVRAKRFLELRGIHALQHATKGRVMVDAKTFLRRVVPGDEDQSLSRKKGMLIYEDSKCRCAVCRKEVDEKPTDYDHDVREIKDDEMLLCSSMVLGFALSSHKWIQMRIDDLSDVPWSDDAVDRLVLDKKQKKVLSSLISSPVFTEGVQGDVIGWKGKGLVMLLHGAPGTGKTLTAESVCESLRRPLYIVSGGELGVSVEAVEKNLEEILELSKLWKAVILIDEADVFLEERSAHDIVRNNFVSVFLRRLEYFEGILMLTTNRVEQFDEAFISRIHLALSYPELEPWMRKEIWANALKRLSPAEMTIDLVADLDEIAKVPLNGRVISYAVRTAQAIANEDQTKLTLEHLWDVVSVQQKFNNHLQLKKT